MAHCYRLQRPAENQPGGGWEDGDGQTEDSQEVVYNLPHEAL